MKLGDIVVRRDQPDDQGTIINVAAGIIIYVHWHGRPPSYEHKHDLRKQEPPPTANKKGRRP